MKIKAKRLPFTGVVALAGASLGCAVSAEDGSGELDNEVFKTEQDLSSTEQCNSVGHNKKETGTPTNWTTSDNYGTAGCHNGYRVEFVNYIGQSVFPDDEWIHAYGYGGSRPSSKSSCEKTRFGLYVWERLPGGGDRLVGSKWEWGNWTGNYCVLPHVFPVEQFGLPNIDVPGQVRVQETYRFAMGARYYNVAKDSSSSYTRQEVRSARLYDGNSY